MAAHPPCPECGGSRWVRYFSETTDENLEEAFRPCPCNYEPDMHSERGFEELERVEGTGVGLARTPKGSSQEHA